MQARACSLAHDERAITLARPLVRMQDWLGRMACCWHGRYTASLYTALVSLLLSPDAAELAGKRLLLFSYGAQRCAAHSRSEPISTCSAVRRSARALWPCERARAANRDAARMRVCGRLWCNVHPLYHQV